MEGAGVLVPAGRGYVRVRGCRHRIKGTGTRVYAVVLDVAAHGDSGKYIEHTVRAVRSLMTSI